MMISHGALLEDVYGTNDISIKKKKKEKKIRSNNIVHFLPEMEKDMEKEKQKHVFPEQLEKIDDFDTSFHRDTNIMPFGDSNFLTWMERKTCLEDIRPRHRYSLHRTIKKPTYNQMIIRFHRQPCEM